MTCGGGGGAWVLEGESAAQPARMTAAGREKAVRGKRFCAVMLAAEAAGPVWGARDLIGRGVRRFTVETILLAGASGHLAGWFGGGGGWG